MIYFLFSKRNFPVPHEKFPALNNTSVHTLNPTLVHSPCTCTQIKRLLLFWYCCFFCQHVSRCIIRVYRGVWQQPYCWAKIQSISPGKWSLFSCKNVSAWQCKPTLPAYGPLFCVQPHEKHSSPERLIDTDSRALLNVAQHISDASIHTPYLP